MTPGMMLLLACACLVTGFVCGPRFPRAWLGLIAASAVCGLSAALFVLAGMGDWEWWSEFRAAGEVVHLRLDGVSALFLALLSIVIGMGAVFSREYWSDAHAPDSAPHGRLWWCGLTLTMVLVLLSSNGLHFLMAWELFAVCSFFLITLDRKRREVRQAGWLYLAASHTGTLCLFAFFTSLASSTGTWDLGPLRERAELQPLFWLVLIGFGVKAGVFPLHVWLPSAHANAPSHVSAVLSGVAIKMGIYGLLRFSGWLPVPEVAGWVVLSLGAISAAFGIAFALAQSDLKRLLAYCSVENIGIIFIGLGAALIGVARNHAAWGKLALAGAFFHVLNHGLFKSLLFFSAGSVVHATGTREMSRLGGLWRAMPWTASLFALGSIAVSGLPPLNGFVSEWLVYLSLFDIAKSGGAVAGAGIGAALLLATAGALALASFAKAAAVVFLGTPRTRATEQAHECGILMRGPMLILAALCLIIGFVPTLFWPGIARAIGAWDSAWVETAPPAPLATVGLAQLALAFLACALAAWLWWTVFVNMRRGLTWDCGYAGPTARMQYTSGSFGGIAASWFAWLLRTERTVVRPRGALPERAKHIERIPETVLERMIVPVGEAVLKISAALRRFQHGRLSAYILYLVAGLIALSLFVLLGGRT